MTTTYASYMQIANNLDRYTTMTSKKTDVAERHEVLPGQHRQDKIRRRLHEATIAFIAIATKAFGLEDMTYAKAMVKKALTEGVDDKNALRQHAHRQALPRPRQSLRLQNLWRHDHRAGRRHALTRSTPTSARRWRASRASRTRASSSPSTSPARRRASTAPTTSSADKNLIKVAQTTLGLSEYTSYQDVDTQAKTLSKLIDFSDGAGPGEGAEVPLQVHGHVRRRPILRRPRRRAAPPLPSCSARPAAAASASAPIFSPPSRA